MQIVGVGRSDRDALCVHTIDLWYSVRRQAWIVERLDHNGDQIGTAHRCESEEEASACLAEWLRAHDETHLVSPRHASAAERRILQRRPRHAA